MSAENAFKKLTGLNPRRDFEPPLIGAALEHALRRARKKGQIFPDTSPTIEDAWLYNHGLEAEEPFTVVIAKLSDKTTQAAYLFQQPPNKDLPLVDFAKTIPQTEWFPFDVSNPGQSGF